MLTADAMEAYYSAYSNNLNSVFAELDKTSIVRIFTPDSHGLNFNLVILNTCVTSFDPADEGALHIVSNEMASALSNIDLRRPTIAIGHHGKKWFAKDKIRRITRLFNDKGVDIYLCGHEHQLGESKFDNLNRNIYQFTCDGLQHEVSDAVELCFLHGIYSEDSNSVHITPYKYESGGNWAINYNLSDAFRESNSFPLDRIIDKKGSTFVTVKKINDIFDILSCNESNDKPTLIEVKKQIMLELGMWGMDIWRAILLMIAKIDLQLLQTTYLVLFQASQR